MTPRSINKLSILVPAYNEEATIRNILDRLCSLELNYAEKLEIVVVNDASKDNTGKIISGYIVSRESVTLVSYNQPYNQGKGAAIRKAMELSSGDFVVVQDADLEYDPQEFDALLAPVINAGADVVYGSRFMGGNPHRILFFWHSVGNKMLTGLSNMFTDLNLSDMETCYKLIRGDYARKLLIRENRFGIEPEITARLSRIKGIRFYEVGISYYGRTYAEGKKIGWKDGFRAIGCILWYNIFDRKVFK